MGSKTYKVHTETFGRLSACIKHAMYGVSLTAMRQQMPAELFEIKAGDIVYISEREVSKNALFGPFYVVNDRPPIVVNNRTGSWVEVDTKKTPLKDIAYWVELENRKWCILFDKTLSNRISILWSYDLSKLKVNLPSWGAVSREDVNLPKLVPSKSRDFLG